MRGKAMAQGMRAKPLLNAGPLGRLLAEVPHRLVGDGLLELATPEFAGEQVDLRFLPAPVPAQFLQQLGCQRNVAVAHTLAPADVNDHALAVDVADLHTRSFRAARTGGVQQHQNRAMHPVSRAIDEPRYLILAEYVG